MANQEALEFNRSVLGREYPRGSFKVTRDLILDFARAVGETNPLYTGEKSASDSGDGDLIAPPSLVTIFAKGEEPEELDLKFDGTIYMAGEWVEPTAPIRPGDLLTCTAKVKDVYQKTGRSGPMAFVVMENTFVNQRGEVVAVVGISSVRRR